MYGILNLSLSNYFSKAIYFRLGTTINISVLIQTLNLYPSDYIQAAVLRHKLQQVLFSGSLAAAQSQQTVNFKSTFIIH